MMRVGQSQLPYAVRGTVWMIVYLFFILAPLFALLAGPLPPARNFWTEFSVALGYAGLAMMGLQFGLTARFRYVTEPWGEDVIYHFHRQISLIAVGLVVAHPLILFAVRPELLALLNSITAPWRARFAALSTYLADRTGGDGPVAREAGTSATRPGTSRISCWRSSPSLAGLLHMVGWGFYLADPLEAGTVDRPDDFLDRAAGLRSHRQAAVHAPPPLSRGGGAPGARRYLDAGDAAGWSSAASASAQASSAG